MADPAMYVDDKDVERVRVQFEEKVDKRLDFERRMADELFKESVEQITISFHKGTRDSMNRGRRFAREMFKEFGPRMVFLHKDAQENAPPYFRDPKSSATKAVRDEPHPEEKSNESDGVEYQKPTTSTTPKRVGQPPMDSATPVKKARESETFKIVSNVSSSPRATATVHHKITTTGLMTPLKNIPLLIEYDSSCINILWIVCCDHLTEITSEDKSVVEAGMDRIYEQLCADDYIKRKYVVNYQSMILAVTKLIAESTNNNEH